jgi:hypothetical protein
MGDPVEVARAMLAKYRPFAAELFSPGGRKVWAARQNRIQEVRQGQEFGKRVWSWKSDSRTGDWQGVVFDITPHLAEGSDFELTFVREAGGELKIRSIEVDQDGVGISSDKHEGRTGINGGPRSENNVYRFHLPMVVPRAKYTVKASIRTELTAKSAGPSG